MVENPILRLGKSSQKTSTRRERAKQYIWAQGAYISTIRSHLAYAFSSQNHTNNEQGLGEEHVQTRVSPNTQAAYDIQAAQLRATMKQNAKKSAREYPRGPFEAF